MSFNNCWKAWLITLALDLHLLQEACRQRPPIGGNRPVSLSFDLYNTASPPSTTSTAPASITVTSSATATASHSNPSAVKLGVGIGLGLGIPFCILVALVLFLYRDRHHQSASETEEQMRRRWEADHQERMQGENRVRQTPVAEMMVPVEQLFAEKDGQQVPEVPEKD